MFISTFNTNYTTFQSPIIPQIKCNDDDNGRDPILFPSFIHTQKRNPQTHLKDPDAFWDFISLMPMTTHQVSFLFSDRGTPNGYRFMNG